MNCLLVLLSTTAGVIAPLEQFSTLCVSPSSFTWTSSRMDRSIVSVLSGQTVDFFDQDFRELYAASDEVDLYKEFNITKPPVPAPAPRPKVEPLRPVPMSVSRFQISVDDTKKVDLRVPAHKYHNPKYSLVFGNNRGFTGSLQDLSTATDSLIGEGFQRNGLSHPAGGDQGASEEGGGDQASQGTSKKNQPVALKKRSSFRHFLKGKAGNQVAETIEEGVVTPQSPAPLPCGTPEMSNGVLCAELDDTFELLDKPAPLKVPKAKKPAKVISRSLSLQTLNTGDADGTSLSTGGDMLFSSFDPPSWASVKSVGSKNADDNAASARGGATGGQKSMALLSLPFLTPPRADFFN